MQLGNSIKRRVDAAGQLISMLYAAKEAAFLKAAAAYSCPREEVQLAFQPNPV